MRNPVSTLLAFLLAGLAPLSAQDGFKSIFDGKTLAGWDGNPDLWSVEDGALTGKTKGPDHLAYNQFLIWRGGAPKNFEFHAKARCSASNSGIQYRSKVVDAAGFVVGGYQADFEAGKTYSGILYEERGRGILAERGQRTRITEVNGQTRIVKVGDLAPSAELQANIRANDWNDYVVIADGNHLMHFINGRMTIEVIDEQAAKAAKSGVLALQIHAGPPMQVQFKDILLKRLP